MAVTSYRSDAGTYRVVPADAGSVMRVEVLAANSSGESDPARSAPSGVVTMPVPVNTQPPVIKGGASPVVGTGLGSNQGKWTGQPTLYENQWLRCDETGDDCTELMPYRSGTGTYRARPDDVGHTLRVRYIASNGSGASTPAVSAPSGVVGP